METNSVTPGNSSTAWPVYETHLPETAKSDIRDANFHHTLDDRADDNPTGLDIAATVHQEAAQPGMAQATD